MHRIASFAVTVLAALTALTANARNDFETIELGKLYVGEGQTKSISLGRARYVRNLIIQAEADWSESSIEIMVNGVVKGTLYAPERDPSYVVTIAETARSIQFRHRFGGAMRIKAVEATVSSWSGRPDQPGNPHGSGEDAYVLTQEVLRIVADLKPYVDLNDETHYLFPIKSKGNYALIYLEAHGYNSAKANAALTALLDQIDYAKPFIDSLMQSQATFGMAVDLLSHREHIADLLD